MKSKAPLTARYRPQLFAEVAGQEAIRAILSRAAAQGKVAPAYLLSGTRGVGKTTLARIFAKALNCVNGPGPEPCNQCESCRQITQGIAVDVAEIDGASNRGIDDAKRLKEDIGYAPMEGRYKIFIIDEAHMLTREAFNALLKTLEEPPERVTFILATTEPHKFPATIISRCQHFIFKRLTQLELKAHLSKVLSCEEIEFEEEAVTLLARRAAGSVRDGMSLLGQVLALGSANLSEDDTRNVLGLAGQELFLQLIQATVRQDCVQVAQVVESLLEKGVDMGFFLRELGALWRNLFMLRQAGKAAYKILDITPAEGDLWQEGGKELATAHIHACWQLTLEGQRRVLDSLEPGQALELLLLNIAILPSLIPVANLPDVPVAPMAGAAPQANGAGGQCSSGSPVTGVTGVTAVPSGSQPGGEKKNYLANQALNKSQFSHAQQLDEPSDFLNSAAKLDHGLPLQDSLQQTKEAEQGTELANGTAAKLLNQAIIAGQSKKQVSVKSAAQASALSTSSGLDTFLPNTSTDYSAAQAPDSKNQTGLGDELPVFDDEDMNWQEGYGSDLTGSELEDHQLAFVAEEELFDDTPFLQNNDASKALQAAKPARVQNSSEHGGLAQNDRAHVQNLKFVPSVTSIPEDPQAAPAIVAPAGLSGGPGLSGLPGENEEFTPTEIASEIPKGLEALFADESALKAWAEFIQFCLSNRQVQQAEANAQLGVGSENNTNDGELDNSNEMDERDETDETGEMEELGFSGQVRGGADFGINPLLLHKAKGAFKGSNLHIICPSDISYEHILLPAQTEAIKALAENFLGKTVALTILPPVSRAKTRGDLRREGQQHPRVLLLKEKLGAYLLDCIPENDA